MKYRLLKQLYKIHSKSGFEGEIITFVCKWISMNVHNAKIDLDWDTGNIYITKGTSKTYPCVVAHLDQVQRQRSVDRKRDGSGAGSGRDKRLSYGHTAVSRRDFKF